jgi:8-oxo-dGTP pyrophosphatase MutT (NUDIX family)
VEWTVHGERVVYSSWWASFHLIDVELPSGRRFEHEALRLPQPAVATVTLSEDAASVLMIWRHRLITGAWGWELPAGRVEPGEDLAAAAARETLEETGWEPHGLAHAVSYHPTSGMFDQTFHLFTARGATHRGDPTDPDEASEVAWVPLAEVRTMAAERTLVDGLALSGLLWVLAFGAPA